MALLLRERKPEICCYLRNPSITTYTLWSPRLHSTEPPRTEDDRNLKLWEATVTWRKHLKRCINCRSQKNKKHKKPAWDWRGEFQGTLEIWNTLWAEIKPCMPFTFIGRNQWTEIFLENASVNTLRSRALLLGSVCGPLVRAEAHCRC